jgi:hypothetical protein
MVERNERVIELLSMEIRRRPGLQPGVLYQLAISIDPSLARIGEKRFGAYYITPAKQRAAEERRVARHAPARGRRSAAARPTTGSGRARRPAGGAVSGTNGVPLAARAAAETAEREARGSRPARRAPVPRIAASVAKNGDSGAVKEPLPAAGKRLERQHIRVALLEFAGELAAAEKPGELVGAIQGLDRRIERLLDRPAA